MDVHILANDKERDSIDYIIIIIHICAMYITIRLNGMIKYMLILNYHFCLIFYKSSNGLSENMKCTDYYFETLTYMFIYYNMDYGQT